MLGAALAPSKGRAVPRGAGTAAVRPWDVGVRLGGGHAGDKQQSTAQGLENNITTWLTRRRGQHERKHQKTNHKLAYSGGAALQGARFFHPRGSEGQSSGSEPSRALSGKWQPRGRACSSSLHARPRAQPCWGQPRGSGRSDVRGRAATAALEDAAGPPRPC